MSTTLVGANMQKAGAIVQVVNTQTGTVATGTTVLPVDDTVPANTEGTEFFSLAITPTNSSNLLKIEVVFCFGLTVATGGAMALFQDSTSAALAASTASTSGIHEQQQVFLTHWMTAGTVSSTTFKIRGGPASAATMTFNGSNSAQRFLLKYASTITITEIQV
jgi:hypothetical protein